MASVLDTSFLIALAKIGKLELLEHLSARQAKLVPEGVREELQVGRRKGYREATQILDTLDRLKVQTRKIQAPTVDDALLALARTEKAELFSNDGELREHARAAGLAAFGPEDFLFLLLCQEVLDIEEYRRLIGALQRQGLIGRERMAQYLDLNI